MSFQIIALDPILGSLLILTSVILMVLVIINLFVSAILMSFGKERKSLKVGNSVAWLCERAFIRKLSIAEMA